MAALASAANFEVPVLTDDLALRRVIEGKGGTAVGSVGILVRAYGQKKLERSQLIESVNMLFNESTLHMSAAFRNYTQKLLKDLL